MNIEAELLQIFSPQIQPFCGPLFFTSSLITAKGTIEGNASFGLVDTGEKKLLVTCDHVLKEFDDLRLNISKLMIAVCLEQGAPVILEPALVIDRNMELDLATFDIESLLIFCKGRDFYKLDHNPPPDLKRGDSLAFHGYPGGRRVGRPDAIEFGRITFATTVGDTSGFKVIANMENVLRIEPHHLDALADPYGGSSGSPVFLRTASKFPQLAGFTTSFGLKLLTFTHASCIQADGTIRSQKASSRGAFD